MLTVAMAPVPVRPSSLLPALADPRSLTVAAKTLIRSLAGASVPMWINYMCTSLPPLPYTC